MDEPTFPAEVGSPILLDKLGAMCVRMEPSGEVGVILDMEGRLNKLDIRDVHRYAMNAGMAAELIAELIVAAHTAAEAGSAMEITGGREFAIELEAALEHEHRRLRGDLK